MALLTLARTAEVEVARILEPAGLSVRKLGMLQRLAAVPGATPADLARTVGITTEDAAPVLRALTAAGLVKRGRDGTMSVTETGSEALSRVDAGLARLDDRLFSAQPALASALSGVVRH
jgi:DNA-binding MarR family transcriptional regulator